MTWNFCFFPNIFLICPVGIAVLMGKAPGNCWVTRGSRDGVECEDKYNLSLWIVFTGFFVLEWGVCLFLLSSAGRPLAFHL